ncbi:hypothetical protein AYO44_12835 [Planctomycetaceae bacterium SCGC AG-212-F19]|nr:hypothetical protein AYO44_12835 [Planctomycetaceae bacterium SCGC AG-212-F19]
MGRLQAARAEVEAAIRGIRDFHKQGQSSLHSQPDKGAYGEGQIKVQAEALGSNETYVHKSRQFADQYGDPELSELCALLREHRPQFGMSHVLLLVTVEQKAQRRRLQARCIRENWSYRELQDTLKRRFGKRRQAGRRWRVGKDPADVLVRLEERTGAWLRLYGIIGEETENGKEQSSRLDQLPRPVRRDAQAACSALEQLRVSIAAALDKSRAGAGPLRG